MVWLCTEHQKQDGITILSDEAADLNSASQDVDMNSAFQDFTSNERQKGPDTARPRTAASKAGTSKPPAKGSTSATKQSGS